MENEKDMVRHIENEAYKWAKQLDENGDDKFSGYYHDAAEESFKVGFVEGQKYEILRLRDSMLDAVETAKQHKLWIKEEEKEMLDMMSKDLQVKDTVGIWGKPSESHIHYLYKFLQFMLNQPITVKRAKGDEQTYYPPEFNLILGEFAAHGEEYVGRFWEILKS